jgi:hypothetical protein
MTHCDMVIQNRSERDNIRMDLREMGWVGMDWMHLAQDRNQWRTVEKR